MVCRENLKKKINAKISTKVSAKIKPWNDRGDDGELLLTMTTTAMVG